MNRISLTPAKNLIISKPAFFSWFINEIHPSLRSFLYLKSPVVPTCQWNEALHCLNPIHISSLMSNSPPRHPIFWSQQTPRDFLGILSCLLVSPWISFTPLPTQQSPIHPSSSSQMYLLSEFLEFNLCPTLITWFHSIFSHVYSILHVEYSYLFICLSSAIDHKPPKNMKKLLELFF